MMKSIGQKTYAMWQNVKLRLKNEKGAELMEWIGMCLVIIAILGAIIAFFGKDGSDDGIGSKIADFIKKQIDNLTNPKEGG